MGDRTASPTQQIISTQRMPPEVVPYFTKLLDASQLETQRPYAPYGAQRIAGFTQPEVAAQQGIVSLGLSGGPMQQRMATEAARGVGIGMGELLGPSGIMSIRDFSPEVLDQYMNPYRQAVTEAQKRAAVRDTRRQMAALKGRTAAEGAFGGYRHGLMEQGLEMGLARQQSEIEQQNLMQNYQDAIGLLTGARGQQLQALQAQGGIASLMGNLGQVEQAQQIERLGLMEGVGRNQRALQQAGLDVGYQDYLRQFNYPKDQLGFMSTILQGLPYMGHDQSSSTYVEQPGLFQSALGTGIAGLGLYNAYNQS